MKTLIAIPCMEHVAAGFCQSLAMLRKVGEVAVTHVSGSLVYDSRNQIAKKAIQMGADCVMWLDSDMIFQPDTLEKLMNDIEEKDLDVVSGLYFRRSGSYRPVIFKSLMADENGEAHWEGYDDYPKDSLFEVEGIGFGCVLMKTEVLLGTAGKFGDWFTPMGHFGEDLAFCLRAREAGYKIYVDSSVKLGHVGTVIVNSDFYEAYERAENESNR